MSTVRTVYTNFMAARSAIKDLSRLKQISVILIRHGFGHIVSSFNVKDQAVAQVLHDAQQVQQEHVQHGDSEHAQIFERIYNILQELGPTFVKLGQILSTRSDLIPPALCEQLKQLQDQVTPVDWADIKLVLEAELACPLEDVFEEFDIQPLACASIAQVHTARLKDQQEVVVKIQRPSIKEIIESDLSILHFITRQIIDVVPEAEAFRPDQILREFEKAIIKELDFHYEARNLTRFERNFSEWESVHIPKYYSQYSSQRVLVMERLHGDKITEADPRLHPMPELAQEVLHMIFKQVFEDGFFHGDLHPGNLFILEDSRIGLIDFGMVGRMTPRMRDEMADLFLNITLGNYEGVARNLYDLSIHSEVIQYSLWEADVIDLMDQHFTQSSLADVDFSQIVRGLIEGAVRHKAQIPSDYTMFFKAIMTVEGIGKIISPDLDLIAECRPYVQNLVAQRYQPERLVRESVDMLHAFVRFSKRLPHTAQHVMEQIEEQKLGLQINDPHFLDKQRHHQKLQNRLLLTYFTIALWGVSLILGIAGQGLEWGHALSLLCGTFGTLLAFRILWRILIKEDW